MLTFAPVRDQRLARSRPPPRPAASPSAPRGRATSRWSPLSSSTPFSSYQRGRVDVGVLALGLAAQVLLGERRALVGRLRLAADQQDRPLGAPLAQLGGAVRRRPCRRRSAGSRPAVGHRRSRRRRRGRRTTFRSSSSPGSSTASTSSPASSTVSAVGHEALARRAAPRSAGCPRASPGRRPACRSTRRVLAEQHLDDLEPLLRQVEQVHEPVLGHLVLDQPQDQVGRRDRRA